MKLVVGLGNPGKKYKDNRHNIGFLLLDRIAKKNALLFKKRINYDFAKLNNSIFIKPKTYMNRSGIAVTSILAKHKLDDIIVVVDDINLPLGEIRLRCDGGYGGHNGLKSIGNSLGSDEFKRLRIGVGYADEKELSEYVLSDFSGEENEILKIVLELSEILIEEYINYDFDRMVDKYSVLKKSYSEKLDKSQDQ
ncbi:MAG: aminoacyl-tRNA hydrolase [Candidatus Cloacimonetes bacterium]|nr:aminoacyl-tRNA hydrolase [Candidatus Cloacimonadota bacterium]